MASFYRKVEGGMRLLLVIVPIAPFTATGSAIVAGDGLLVENVTTDTAYATSIEDTTFLC